MKSPYSMRHTGFSDELNLLVLRSRAFSRWQGLELLNITMAKNRSLDKNLKKVTNWNICFKDYFDRLTESVDKGGDMID